MPDFIPRRFYPADTSAWAGHLAFAHDLIAEMRPSAIVELGTHWGESYFTFCQTVAEHGLPTRCYAVDTWLGEKHAGFYGETVYENVSAYNQSLYAPFSQLLRATFDDAASQFADASIDLLHIDGLHTYAAVKHDFENWFPKVRPGGIVLLHDVAVWHSDFGVWRLWQEICARYPDHFAFEHWWGLGVVRKPDGAGAPQTPLLQQLFSGDEMTQAALRKHYAERIVFFERLLRPPKTDEAIADFRIYPRTNGAFDEEKALWQTVANEDEQTLTFNFAQDRAAQIFRLDPAEYPCEVEFYEIIVVSLEDPSKTLWSTQSSEDWDSITVAGTAERLPHRSVYTVFSYGRDPQLILPALPDVTTVSLIVRFRISRSVERAWVESKEREHRLNLLQSERTELLRQLETEQSVRASMEQSVSWKLTKPVRQLKRGLRSS